MFRVLSIQVACDIPVQLIAPESRVHLQSHIFQFGCIKVICRMSRCSKNGAGDKPRHDKNKGTRHIKTQLLETEEKKGRSGKRAAFDQSIGSGLLDIAFNLVKLQVLVNLVGDWSNPLFIGGKIFRRGRQLAHVGGYRSKFR